MSALSEAELAQTGNGTSGGDLLRGFWQPIAAESEIHPSAPILPVCVLGERLLLIRTTSGDLGLVQERCPHNGYPLAEGTVSEGSLVCPRHGWHFGIDGACWVVGYQDKIYPVQWANAKSYPVMTAGGIHWAYLGPLPVPPFPELSAIGESADPPSVVVQGIQPVHWLESVVQALCHGQTLINPHHSLQPGMIVLRRPVDDESTWLAVIHLDRAADGSDLGTDTGPDANGPDIAALRSQVLRSIIGD
ncbi:MAG: Rieske 2Fe-2S domain-containing protein [Chloroflexota bacterium]